jgi:undecaprenyl-diphosphatase
MDVINYFLSLADKFSYVAPILVLVVPFLESLAFVGLLVPGTVFLLILGGLLSMDHFLDFGDAIWIVALGAVLGHSLSFYLGRHGSRLFKEGNRLFKLSHLATGEKFFKRHGAWSVFLGQFVGGVRPMTAFVAGMFKMDWKKFLFFTISSAFGWSAFYLSLGYFFGTAWQMVEAWMFHVIIIIASIILFYILRWVYLRNKKKFTGLNSFLSFLIPAAVLCGVFIYLLVTRASLIDSFHLEEYLYSVRSQLWVNIFLWITVLGKEVVLLYLAGIVSIILWLYKKQAEAVSLWIAVLGAGLFAILGKTFLHHLRPEGFIPVYIEDSSSFPSGHATLSLAFYGYLTSFLWREVYRKWFSRALVILTGVALIGAIGFSRLYLGVHYLSDVLGGYVIGLFWLFIADSIMGWKFLQKDIIFPNISASHRRLLAWGMILWWFLFYITYALSWQASLII